MQQPIIVDGVEYEAKSNGVSCNGCAGQSDSRVCAKLPECSIEEVIFVVKQKQ